MATDTVLKIEVIPKKFQDKKNIPKTYFIFQSKEPTRQTDYIRKSFKNFE